MSVAIDEPPELAAARRLGRLEGERFAWRLGELERREREELLSRWLLAQPEASAGLGTTVPETGRVSAAVERLRREVAQLQSFHDAVVGSAGWRWLETGRRLLGRQWVRRGAPAEEEAHAAAPSPADPDAAAAALERRRDELAAFQAAVVRSGGWRAVQALRRPFGREW